MRVIDPALLSRANAVLERLFMLDEAIANSWAFRTLLEVLHARDISNVKEPHIGAISMVRAGILRAEISAVMALLDPADRRGNRASIGQILDMMRDSDVADVLTQRQSGQPTPLHTSTLQDVRNQYATLIKGDLFDRGRRLRNDAIAHLLISNAPTPDLSYEAIYALQNEAEGLTIALHDICDRRPQFIAQRAMLDERAKVFWQTYFEGMSAGSASFAEPGHSAS
jgi:hypothetical protein